MSEFLVTVSVKTASGWQQFKVNADTKEEAIALVKNGGGEFQEEELEVDSLNFNNATTIKL